MLLNHCKSLYKHAIHKFPTSSALRLAYSLFLIEYMNKKQEALNEIN